MKTYQYLWVPALTGLLFAACNNQVQGPSQAELDTQVEAKVKAATDQLKSDCDARILQAAQLQADSMMAKAAPTPAPAKTTKPTTRATTPTPPPPPPPPVKQAPATTGNGKPMMGASAKDPNTVGNGKPKMGGVKDEAGKSDPNTVGNGKPKMGGNK
jgi:hypothetical protein